LRGQVRTAEAGQDRLKYAGRVGGYVIGAHSMAKVRGRAFLPFLLAAALGGSALPGAWAQSAGGTAKKPPAPICDRAAFRVVVDVGHTAESPGAMSARGFGEYDFNLRLAKSVVKSLRDAGFDRTVLLITEGKTRKGLAERVTRANSLSPDLFFSIHHDSVPDSFLQFWEYEGQRHGYSDRFNGHSLFISADNADPPGSLLFGQMLGMQLRARGLQYTPHYTQKFMGHRQRVLVDAEAGVYRYDQLIVLKNTNMPAVLLEAGSIINRQEELVMGSPERQALVSAAVTDAVEVFCAVRRPLPPERIARPPAVASKPALAPSAAATQPAAAPKPR
jgi:N-acetylmuramoyl-L-alanine amidase